MTVPARKLTKSAVKNIVRFPAIKANGGKSILVESILESKFCLLLEFNPTVARYFPQPKTHNFLGQNGEEISYTPDFKVHYLSGDRSYIEVKPLSRQKSPQFQNLITSFESYLDSSSINFSVVSEQEIYSQPRLANFEKLYQFRKRPDLDMEKLYQSAARIGEEIKLSALVSELNGYASLREIYTWLALGFLEFNLCNEPLTLNTEVVFHVDGFVG